MNKNYKSKIEEIKRIMGTFRSSYSKGCVKITRTESKEHARVKTEVGLFLLKQGYHIWSEATFKQPYKGRADLIAVHPSGISYIFEIVSSEKEKSLLRKARDYPTDVIAVDVKTFKYEEFEI